MRLNGERRSRLKRYTSIAVICVLIGGGIVMSLGNLFQLWKDKIVDEKSAYEGLIGVEEEVLQDAAVNKITYDYENGDAGVGPDDDSVLDESMVSDEGNIMCQDFYDSAGNLLWKGITLDEAEKADESLKQQFDEAYQKYSESTMEVSENTKLAVSDTGLARDRLTSLCISYDRSIPYAEDGFDYYMGYFVEEDGFDNLPYIKNGQKGFGLCGMGYITWVMRNVFGYTPEAFMGKTLHTDLMKEVQPDGLLTGDICIAISEHGRQYGVVIGRYEGHTVVSMCNALSEENYPCGCNHLVYIKQEHDEELNTFSAVDFTRFYRLNENWEGEREK